MLVTVTGGSGSGKSAYAEQTAVRLAEGGRLLYLATMMRDGAGAQERIRRHRALRSGKGFLTIEKTDSLCETAGLGQCCVPLSAVSASNCSS